MKTLIIEKEKTRDFLEKVSFLAMKDAEKKMKWVLSRKLMLYKESEMKHNEIKTLQKTSVSLEEKRSKM